MGVEESRMAGGGRGDPMLQLLTEMAMLERGLKLRREQSNVGQGGGALGWDAKDCSDNLEVLDDGAKVKRKDASNRTDMVRAKYGHKNGISAWLINWPKEMRGSHAVIGVATTRASLTCSGYKCLLGSDDQSLGWDIVNNRSLFNDCVIGSFPKNKPQNYQVGENIIVILDLTEGVLSFRDGEEDLGACLTGLQLFARQDQALFPAVSVTKQNAVVGIRYIRGGPVRQPQPSSGISSSPSSSNSDQLHFMAVKDSEGLRLSNNSMTITVADENRENKIALSHRALKTDELFQIRIDDIKSGSRMLLHLGVILVNPENQKKDHRIWSLISSQILFNGEKLQQFTKLNVDDLQQGQRIGVMRRSNGRLDIFIDEALKAKCNLNIPEGVLAYVCLDGRAKTLTIEKGNVEIQSLSQSQQSQQQSEQSSQQQREQQASSSRPQTAGELLLDGLHGAQIEISNNSKTASRKNYFNDDDHGVVLASRHLRVDEFFEISIDKVIEKWETGLRIGGVQVSDSLSALPASLLNLKTGGNKVWAWSGEIVLGDGFLQTRTDICLDKIQKGDRVGMYQTNDRTLYFLHNDRKVAEVPNAPAPILPAIDVHGKVVQVSLTARSGKSLQALGSSHPVYNQAQQQEVAFNNSVLSRADEIQKGIKFVLSLMSEKKIGRIKEVTVAVYEKIMKVRDELTSDKHKVMMADTIAELGGGEIIMSYLQFLREQGLEIDVVNNCYFIILNALWNETDDSMKLSVALAENGLFELLKKQLTTLKVKYASDKKAHGNLLGTCIGILCNCAKRSENRCHIPRVGLDDVIVSFLNTAENDENTILFGYVSLIYLLPNTTIQKLSINTGALNKIVNFLKTAASDKEFNVSYNFSELGEGIRMHGFEIIMAIGALAHNKEAKKAMIVNNVFTHLVTYAQRNSDTYHQELVLIAIHSLLAPDTVQAALSVTGFEALLDLLAASETDGVRQEAIRVKEKLKASKVPPKPAFGGQVLIKSTQPCEFENLCKKYFSSLCLPAEYFETKFSMCYCPTCYEKMSGETEPYFPRGNPPKDYGIPIGWYRFGLKAPAKAFATKAFDVYHRAYHGTTFECIKPILEEGGLLLPGDINIDGKKIAEKEGHYNDEWKPSEFDTKKIFLSPSIRYVAYPTYAKPKKVNVNGKTYQAQAVLQTLIKPETYEVGRQTLDLKVQIDPRFSNDELEWSSKQRGAIIIYGILLRLQETKQ